MKRKILIYVSFKCFCSLFSNSKRLIILKADSHTSPLLAEVQAILEALPEVDASYSEKIPLHERRAGLEDILTALKRVYLERTQMEATAAWDVVQPGGKRKEFSIIDRLAFPPISCLDDTTN